MPHTLHLGDCLDILRTMPDNSVDAVVTDPPYGLSFMGKRWDYDVPSEDIWRECLRVLKPGGHLLAFAGTRTQHRMAVRIEDAGFEIRDMIAWVYGSGFPKSLDVSKAIDKAAPRAGMFNAFAVHFAEKLKASGKTQKEMASLFPSKTGGLTGCIWNWANGANVPTLAQWNVLQPLLGLSLEWLPLIERTEAEREVVGTKRSSIGGTVAAGERNEQFINKHKNLMVDITAPATDAAKQWHGWGTALKPALEPITVARKPLIGTVAENVLTWGTGGVNVDGCRVGIDPVADASQLRTMNRSKKSDVSGWGMNQNGSDTPTVVSANGRWPANLIHDGSEEVVGLFPETKATGRPNCIGKTYKGVNDGSGEIYNDGYAERTLKTCNMDSGSAARFFYCAKASKRDRDEGCEGMEAKKAGAMAGGAETRPDRPTNHPMRTNHHPTVKPTDLMRYLCRLVTPPDGTVLDPFMGSGSTGKAAVLEGFKFIGIEREPEYLEIARARITHAQEQKETRLL